MRFTPLPGTEAEAKAIKATFNKDTVSEYQQNKATESNSNESQRTKDPSYRNTRFLYQ